MDNGQNNAANFTIDQTGLNNPQTDIYCNDCEINSLSSTNTAQLTNKIISQANTGANSIDGSGQLNINTGNAYSSVSLVNLVNLNVIRSSGFIGFINIFGSLVGDIGGSSLFAEEETEEVSKDVEPETETVDQQIKNDNESDSLPPERESGGIPEVTHTNNVGTHVLPGDTVTFFAKIKNVGYGKIYDAKLRIELFKEGISYGGSYFNLGDINAQKALRFSTGLVLSKKATTGTYIARVTVVGAVGPDNHEVSAYSESEFKILAAGIVSAGSFTAADPVIASSDVPAEVLGTAKEGLTQFERIMITLFASLLSLYLAIRVYQKRQIIITYAYRIGSLL